MLSKITRGRTLEIPMGVTIRFRHLLGVLFAAGLVFLAATRSAGAEEIVLKDGRKITGTIVGVENEMFRVETEYGFALIRKDKVSSVNMLVGGEKKPAEKSGENPANAPLKTRGKTSATNGAKPEPSATLSQGATVTAPSRVSPRPPTLPVSRPLDEPLPAGLQEHVEGVNYFSDTFHFAMYKPPGWKIYEGLQREAVSAIVAMATEDERTLFFVDRQVWSGQPDLKNDAVGANLRRTYEDYKKLGESEIQLDAHPAIERSFTGLVDGVEWHGISVHTVHGNAVFGIIGLTSAEQFEFEKAVFNKIIKSFHFLTPEPVPQPRASAR